VANTVNLAARSRPGQPRSSWAIRRVVGTLEAKARFTTGIPDVFVRVGQNGDGADTAYFRFIRRMRAPRLIGVDTLIPIEVA
jgi:hypothetical protein